MIIPYTSMTLYTFLFQSDLSQENGPDKAYTIIRPVIHYKTIRLIWITLFVYQFPKSKAPLSAEKGPLY